MATLSRMHKTKLGVIPDEGAPNSFVGSERMLRDGICSMRQHSRTFCPLCGELVEHPMLDQPAGEAQPA